MDLLEEFIREWIFFDLLACLKGFAFRFSLGDVLQQCFIGELKQDRFSHSSFDLWILQHMLAIRELLVAIAYRPIRLQANPGAMFSQNLGRRHEVRFYVMRNCQYRRTNI